MTIRVLVADDQELVRAGFSALLRSDVGVEVVGEASDGMEAVALARTARPDVVLMDVRMPILDGIEATRRILAEPEVRPDANTAAPAVMMLTTFDLDEYVYAALRAGAAGFLLKDTPPAQLLQAVRVLAAGDALLAPRVTRRLVAEFARRPDPAVRPSHDLRDLTEREVQVLRYVATGMTNAEIAANLFVSEATVKTHLGRIMMKLHLSTRAQAVVVAYESGLVTPGAAPESVAR